MEILSSSWPAPRRYLTTLGLLIGELKRKIWDAVNLNLLPVGNKLNFEKEKGVARGRGGLPLFSCAANF